MPLVIEGGKKKGDTVILDWGKDKHHDSHHHHSKEYHHHHFHHQDSDHDDDDDWPDFEDHRWTKDFKERMRRRGLPASSVHHHHHHQKKSDHGHAVHPHDLNLNDDSNKENVFIHSAASVSFPSGMRDVIHGHKISEDNQEQSSSLISQDFDYNQFINSVDETPVMTQMVKVASRLRDFVSGDINDGKIDYLVNL